MEFYLQIQIELYYRVSISSIDLALCHNIAVELFRVGYCHYVFNIIVGQGGLVFQCHCYGLFHELVV